MSKGKNAIVTGSTSGIGLGIAEALASAGMNGMLNGFGDDAEIERIRADFESEHGVTVNAICPGYVLLAAQPTKQFVTTEQLGALAVFLCTDAAASTTGTALPVEGGWTAQ